MRFCAELRKVIEDEYSEKEIRLLYEEFHYSLNCERPILSESYFLFVMVDPRISQNIPYQIRESRTFDLRRFFVRFLESIFYIGAGNLKQPIQCLEDARRVYAANYLQARERTRGVDQPVKFFRWLFGSCPACCSRASLRPTTTPRNAYINDIWDAGYGVVVLPFFCYVTRPEALSLKASMVETLGKRRITNRTFGEFQGAAVDWSLGQKRLLGSCLLKEAFETLVEVGERQEFPEIPDQD